MESGQVVTEGAVGCRGTMMEPGGSLVTHRLLPTVKPTRKEQKEEEIKVPEMSSVDFELIEKKCFPDQLKTADNSRWIILVVSRSSCGRISAGLPLWLTG
ncbi:hypothetical protein ATANTOWER_016516 [Ataeniobius toweri]|uniref:Uncharacterized protein n=1 Tax=Ataeniobius toweri TaxID=208326 RepID=A0ABU7BQW0_9TELE|nr:hypothetical protein [Ataeniobius toweri]